jgi:hypothetical protein
MHVPFPSDHIQIRTVIFHDANTSKAEGYPTRVRVLMPTFMAYTSTDSMLSNYSTSNGTTVMIEPATYPISDFFDLVFPAGISYPDILWLNFTLTVDPLGKRLPGSGVSSSAVVLSPICQQMAVNSYPSPAGIYTQCGPMVPVSFSAGAPGM